MDASATGRAHRPEPLVRFAVFLCLLGILQLAMAAPVGAATQPEPDGPAISLVKEAVVGVGPLDGDLVLDPDTGLPTLSFSSGSPGDQVAVHQYTVTNTGTVVLREVTLIDDRIGVILDAGLEASLGPGESMTLRATELFTMRDASGGLDTLVTAAATATGTDDDGTEVTATDDAVVQLVAQQASVLIGLDKEVVVGEGDVAVVDGAPTITWQEAELDADEPRTIRYRFTISNVGASTLYDVELVDDMLSDLPLVPATDGTTIGPGATHVLEVDHRVVPADVFPTDPSVIGDRIEGDLLNTATVRGSNEARDAFDEVSDTAAVFVRVPRAEVVANDDQLPAAGPIGTSTLLPLAMLLGGLGATTLRLSAPRRRAGR